MALTFVHTADWHLGHIYWGIGERATESAQWRVDAVRRIWALAAETGAQFILVAGDVFDSDTPSPHWRSTAAQLLADAPAPVVLIAGNHDPCSEGSVWREGEFARAVSKLPRLHLALSPHPLEILPGVTIFPCPVTRKHHREDTTAWIPEGDRGESYRIGLAHGHWRGYFSGGEELVHNVIEPYRAERCGLDYLALGDYHGFTPPDHAAAKLRSYYSGTPEVGARDNDRAGYALEVRIDSPGAVPVVTPHAVGRVKIIDWGAVELGGEPDLQRLEARISALGNAEDSIVRGAISGTVAPEDYGRALGCLESLRAACLGTDIARDGLGVYPTVSDFEALRLESLELSVLQRLQARMESDEASGLRGGGSLLSWSGDVDAKREAIALYYNLLREVKP